MLNKTQTEVFREHWTGFIRDLQKSICDALEEVDGKATFSEENWEREPDGSGGGGKTRVMARGNVFEKAGVNTSVVFGDVSEKMRTQLQLNGENWFASGISLVLHPFNPFVPTVHCNYRYFELYEGGNVTDRWFGGGTDLTPFYLFEEDALHFHQTYKALCDNFDGSMYSVYKKNCDDYFVNTHRNNERRGIGGIFYDHERPADKKDLGFWWGFAKACGRGFSEAYLPIVEKRKNTAFNADNKHWQEIRRGRYAEFNLVHDKGTLFGLKTHGRTESILMSLPPTARFEYNFQPIPGTEEHKLLEVCLSPREWV